MYKYHYSVEVYDEEKLWSIDLGSRWASEQINEIISRCIRTPVNTKYPIIVTESVIHEFMVKELDSYGITIQLIKTVDAGKQKLIESLNKLITDSVECAEYDMAKNLIDIKRELTNVKKD